MAKDRRDGWHTVTPRIITPNPRPRARANARVGSSIHPFDASFDVSDDIA